jgi:rhodanese-related sulfurtransferase
VTTVFQLEAMLRDNVPVVLLDVREADEYALCHIAGSISIPLLEVPDRLNDFDPAAEMVVCCHTGNKSLDAVKFLVRQGFERVSNLEGGIDLWALAIDRSFPIYGRDPEKSAALKQAFWEKVDRAGFR